MHSANELKEQFKTLRIQCKKETKNCHNNYIDYIENCLHNSNKKFWNYIHSKNNSRGYPSKMYLENYQASSNQSIANLFKKFFSGIYSQSNSSPPNNSIDNSCSESESQVIVSKIEISNSIKKIKNSFNIGTDGIPNAFLKMTLDAIIEPLQLRFSKSLSQGRSHIIWKRSTITPIFKSGIRSDITNYRPITNINAIPSLLDDIVSNRIPNLCTHKLSHQQHGFVRGRSTISNLTIHTQHIINEVVNRKQLDTTYTDFYKAFDMVSHSILNMKLKKFNLPP